MDPNENLKKQLDLVKILLGPTPKTVATRAVLGSRLAELVEELNAYLLFGRGSFPADWVDPDKPLHCVGCDGDHL